MGENENNFNLKGTIKSIIIAILAIALVICFIQLKDLSDKVDELEADISKVQNRLVGVINEVCPTLDDLEEEIGKIKEQE